MGSQQPAAEMVLATDSAAIGQAEPEMTATMVTQALQESKAWLAQAMEASDPTPIAEFKAWAATIEEATKQKKLGREIELDAAEMVRRAERGLGVAIRNGQAAGTVRSYGQGSRDQPRDENNRLSPTDYATRGELSGNSAGIYELTDNVTDEEFEDALTDAKEEGQLTRANLVRKTREQARAETTGRWETIAELATEGYSSRQISAQVNLHLETIRRGSRERGITIPADEVIGRTRRFDSDRIVAETIRALEGAATGLDLIDYPALDPDQLAGWAESLADSMKVLNRFQKQIKHAKENLA